MLLSQKYDHIAVHYIHLWALVYLLPPVESSEGWGGYPSLQLWSDLQSRSQSKGGRVRSKQVPYHTMSGVSSFDLMFL